MAYHIVGDEHGQPVLYADGVPLGYVQRVKSCFPAPSSAAGYTVHYIDKGGRERRIATTELDGVRLA